MIGGQPFTGKTTRAYPAGGVIEVDHPDYREAQVAGWVSVPDVPRIMKGARVGDFIAVTDEVNGHVLAADSTARVFYVAASAFTEKAPADVPSASAV
jgi:hypothetical protein